MHRIRRLLGCPVRGFSISGSALAHMGPQSIYLFVPQKFQDRTMFLDLFGLEPKDVKCQGLKHQLLFESDRRPTTRAPLLSRNLNPSLSPQQQRVGEARYATTSYLKHCFLFALECYDSLTVSFRTQKLGDIKTLHSVNLAET